MPVGNVRVISPSSVARSAARAPPGHTNCSQPSRHARCAGRSSSRSPVSRYYSGIGFRPTSRTAIGDRRRPFGAHSGSIVHEADTETSRYDAYEDNLMTGARFLYSAPNMRSTYRVVPLDINPPTYMRGPGATSGARSPWSPRLTIWRAGWHGPDRAALAQRTRSRRVGGASVLHPPTHRLLHGRAVLHSAGRERNPAPTIDA